MPIGDALKRAAGLFIEVDSNSDSSAETEWRAMSAPSNTPSPAPAPAVKTVDQIVRDSPGPNLDEISTPVTTPQQVVAEDGHVNFAAIYGLAKLPTASFSAEQVLEILGSLPADLPLVAKKATLKVTLDAMGKALGVSPETVVADASRKLAALDSYSQGFVAHVDEYAVKAAAEIAQLEQDILSRKQSIADAKAKSETIGQACHTESERLSKVLEFFSQPAKPA